MRRFIAPKYASVACSFLLAAAFTASGHLAGIAHAQDAKKPGAEASAKKAKLEAIKKQIEKARLRRKQLAAEIDALDNDTAAINRALLESAKSGRELEERVQKAETGLAALDATRDTIRQSLAGKRTLLAEVIGALQRIGRKPPPVILVRPQDALASVRSSILLASLVPEIRMETQTMLTEMTALSKTTRKIEAEKKLLADNLNRLAEDEQRLALLVSKKGSLLGQSRKSLEDEQAKAATLARQAGSLEQLIEILETQIASAARAAEQAAKADNRRTEEETVRLSKAREVLAKDLANLSPAELAMKNARLDRLEPAIAFSKAKGALSQPVTGNIIAHFGAPGAGGARRANTIYATRANARVASPADSWVVYAGPFRSYGQLLILNAGEGYHIVMAGLAETNVTIGRFVLAGEPVGRMGTRSTAAAIGAIGAVAPSNGPALAVEFRKDGKPVDPAGWWKADMRSTTLTAPLAGTTEGLDNDS